LNKAAVSANLGFYPYASESYVVLDRDSDKLFAAVAVSAANQLALAAFSISSAVFASRTHHKHACTESSSRTNPLI